MKVPYRSLQTCEREKEKRNEGQTKRKRERERGGRVERKREKDKGTWERGGKDDEHEAT